MMDVATLVSALRDQARTDAGLVEDPQVTAGIQIRAPERGTIPTAAGDRDLAGLAVNPAAPGYRERIAQMAGDHADEIQATSGLLILPNGAVPQTVDAKPPQRLGVYFGPQPGVLVVALEEAPDWDAVQSWRLTPEQLAPVLPLLDALKIRISDRSGGTIQEVRSGAYDPRPNRKGKQRAPARRPARPAGTRGLSADRPDADLQAPAGISYPTITGLGGDGADAHD